MWSYRREPPPDELGDAEEPRVTSVLQQDFPEVMDLGVTVSDVVELGDTITEVVDLGVGGSGGVVLGVAVSEVELGVALSEVELGDAKLRWWSLVFLCPRWSLVLPSLTS